MKRYLQTTKSRQQNRDEDKGVKYRRSMETCMWWGIEYVYVCSCINADGCEDMCMCVSGGQKMTLEPVTVAW